MEKKLKVGIYPYPCILDLGRRNQARREEERAKKREEGERRARLLDLFMRGEIITSIFEE